MAAMRIDSVAHVAITVSDLDRSMAFYRDVLGFAISKKVNATGDFFDDLTGVPGGDHDVCFVRGPGLIIELICYSKPEGRVSSTLRACDAGAVHIALKVTDLEQVVKAFRPSGFETMSPIQTLPSGPLRGMKVVYMRDSDGVVFELHEEPPGIVLEELILAGATN
jgi:catechol 2,3-dioxygenase-like lactoylglutathione lyase family enzyme